MADQESTAEGLLERLKSERDKLTEALLAKNTRKGYRYAWAGFVRFASRLDASALPATPDTVSLYAVELLGGGLKVATVSHRLAAVARMHRDHHHLCPVTSEVKSLLEAARRLRIEQVHQVLPLSLDHLRMISTGLIAEDTALSLRNRSIVLVGFASALRSANLAGLLLDDAEFSERGVVLKIRHSKTDQAGKGRLVGVPHGKHLDTCPVKSLESWIGRRGNFPGPLFSRLDWHSPRGRAIEPERIGQIVQQAVKRIGLDPKLYGGHSLRAGFVTEAGESGAGELQIASQTGHKDLSVLRAYFRRQDVFRSNPVGLLDL
jgi:integrase